MKTKTLFNPYHPLLWIMTLSLFLPSCAEKIYLQEAQKLSSDLNVNRIDDIQVESYYSGDALQYIVFELDVFNNSDDTLYISRKNIELLVNPPQDRTYVLNPLDKNDVIRNLQQEHRALKSERKANNIANAIGVGLGLIAIGSSSVNVGLDATLYAADSAAYIMEENRAYSLMTGSLEEQIQYTQEWVLGLDTLPPHTENSWDVLFTRDLVDAPARLAVHLEDRSFVQEFDLRVREEKVR